MGYNNVTSRNSEVFLCDSRTFKTTFIQLTGFHETWHEYHVTTGYTMSALYNTLQ
jgi:hypothetical protein